MSEFPTYYFSLYFSLHSTPYTWLSCARRWSAVFFFAPPVGSVLTATPRVLLCLLPTGSPMTPASWGVRRMSFGYFYVVQTSAISRRASSCHWLNPRRIPRVNPRFFLSLLPRISFEFSPPLHSPPYTPATGLVLGGLSLLDINQISSRVLHIHGDNMVLTHLVIHIQCLYLIS